MVYDVTEVLRVESDGPVRVVTLNRPEQLNAFDDELHEQFARLWMYVEADIDARVVVLTGAGRAFCAGGSIDDFDRLREDFAARRRSLRRARRIADDLLHEHGPDVAGSKAP